MKLKKKLKASSILIIPLLMACVCLSACGNAGKTSSDTVGDYIQHLGKYHIDEDVVLSSDEYENMDKVIFMGNEGSVTYHVSIEMALGQKDDLIDELVWVMSDQVESEDEFLQLIESCNDFFGHEAEETPTGYQWKDRENNCMVTGEYEYGEITFTWRYLTE